MNLTEKALCEALEKIILEPKSNKNQKQIQNAAQEKFFTIGLPKHKQAGYEYAMLKSVYESMFAVPSEEKKIETTKDFDGLIFFNGVYQNELSKTELSVENFSYPGLFSPYIQKMSMELIEKTDNPFVLLNHTIDSFGLFIKLEKGQKIDNPIKIINYITSHSKTNLSFRIYLHIPKGSSCKIQLIHQTESDLSPFNLVTYAKVEKDASLEIEETVSNKSIGFHHIIADVKENGSFVSNQINTGAKFYRVDQSVNLEEKCASAKIYGLNITKENYQAHFYANVRHMAEETVSYQQIKNLSFDQSRTSFEGKIFVDKIAQKTKAYQLNQNLVLSEKASNFSKPNLEILADDVKASHGATFAKIDDEELFYLQSRGISKSIAKILLIKSFLSEFIQLIQDDQGKESLEQSIDVLLKDKLC